MKKQALPSYPDVFGISENQRGVKYLYNLYENAEVIAKICTSCDEWKFMNQYNKAGKGFAGTHSLCRDCHQQRNKEYTDYSKVMEKIAELVNEHEHNAKVAKVNQIAEETGLTISEVISIYKNNITVKA